MAERILQSCYTNASYDIGGKVSSGWQSVSVSEDLPESAYNTCVGFQNKNSAIQKEMLDEHGKEFRSIEFAEWLQKEQHTARRLVFVIGGPYGFSAAMYQRANEKLSLSRMTFSHQMVRLIFTEQLYRACTIIKGEPYHHE